jgi:hypothetical protein
MANAQSKSVVRDLRQRAEEIGEETRALGYSLEATFEEIEALAHECMSKRPYTSLAVAGGVGYILGGGLPSPLTRMLALFATRMVVDFAARQTSTRLAAGLAHAGDNSPGVTETGSFDAHGGGNL